MQPADSSAGFLLSVSLLPFRQHFYCVLLPIW